MSENPKIAEPLKFQDRNHNQAKESLNLGVKNLPIPRPVGSSSYRSFRIHVFFGYSHIVCTSFTVSMTDCSAVSSRV